MGMKTEIEKAAGVLAGGGTILYPTDTIWGVGCDATMAESVVKVYGIKQREDTKAMLILVDSLKMLEAYVEEVPEMAREILALASDPLTIIYPGAQSLANNLVHRDGSAGIRITGDPFCRDLIHALGKPIVSTSANRAGKPPPRHFGQIDPAIRDAVDHTVDWRRDEREKRKPSGILKVGLKGEIEVIRG